MPFLAAWNMIPDPLKKFVVALLIVLLIVLLGVSFRAVSCLGHKATEGGTSEKINHSNVPDDSVFDSIIHSLPINR